jgi:hypothetical protein
VQCPIPEVVLCAPDANRTFFGKTVSCDDQTRAQSDPQLAAELNCLPHFASLQSSFNTGVEIPFVLTFFMRGVSGRYIMAPETPFASASRERPCSLDVSTAYIMELSYRRGVKHP